VKERKAYVILAVLMIFLTIALGAYERTQQELNNHKFCDILTVSLRVRPVPAKPADPKKDPVKERQYEGYILVHKLAGSLGCL